MCLICAGSTKSVNINNVLHEKRTKGIESKFSLRTQISQCEIGLILWWILAEWPTFCGIKLYHLYWPFGVFGLHLIPFLVISTICRIMYKYWYWVKEWVVHFRNESVLEQISRQMRHMRHTQKPQQRNLGETLRGWIYKSTLEKKMRWETFPSECKYSIIVSSMLETTFVG